MKGWYTSTCHSIMYTCSFITEFFISLRGICIPGTVFECNLPARGEKPGPDSGVVRDISGSDELMPGLDGSGEYVPESVIVPGLDRD